VQIQLYKTYAYGPEQNNGARFHIIPEIKALWVEWFGYPTEKEYKSIMLEGLALVKERKLEYWITDARKWQLMSEEAGLWTVNEALPIAVQNGLRRFALIVAQEIFAKISTESVGENIKDQLKAFQMNNLQARYFNSLEEAMQWRD
jgi:hypothetical protein